MEKIIKLLVCSSEPRIFLHIAKVMIAMMTCIATLATMSEAASKSLPKVVVFDLDGCVWDPEMYELWGSGGAPFKASKKFLCFSHSVIECTEDYRPS